MTLPSQDTLVTYPQGDTESVGEVLHVEDLGDGRYAVLLDKTAFHPEDSRWPDQPSDEGIMITSNGPVPVIEAVTGGIHAGNLKLGADLPVRMGTPEWTFVVAHIVQATPPQVGETVRIEVDPDNRRMVSAAHTACHIAATALDEILTDKWTKDAPKDSLGNPAFDALAMQHSRMSPGVSRDSYRIGKSLRRKGFPADGFDDPQGIAQRVNERLEEWVAAGGPVKIDSAGPGLSDRRNWECQVSAGTISMPCGGTHLEDVSDFDTVTIELETREVPGGTEVLMTTRATVKE